MSKKRFYLIDLTKEHIRQMEEEEHITAFSSQDLKLSKKYLSMLEIVESSKQELRIENAAMGGDNHVVSFAMLFDTYDEADKFCKALRFIHPGIKQGETLLIKTKYFQFAEYDKAFRYYEQNKRGAQFVVSHHWASEGYWVVPVGTEARLPYDIVYSPADVKGLEKKLRAELAMAKKKGKNPKFIS